MRIVTKYGAKILTNDNNSLMSQHKLPLIYYSKVGFMTCNGVLHSL